MNRNIIGWCEWAGLPDLGVDRINAKIDSGAKTSAIHALHVDAIDIDGEPHVSFVIRLRQDGGMLDVRCCEALADERIIKSSNGSQEKRFVIRTALRLGVYEEIVELSLTDRGSMEFPLLIGRDALGERFFIDPQGSHLARD